jgi:hypothetical protein
MHDCYVRRETEPAAQRDLLGVGRPHPCHIRVLATSLFGDIAAALREDGSATLDDVSHPGFVGGYDALASGSIIV